MNFAMDSSGFTWLGASNSGKSASFIIRRHLELRLARTNPPKGGHYLWVLLVVSGFIRD